jgi:hypothetical protein
MLDKLERLGRKKRTLTLRNKRIWDTSNLPPVVGSSLSLSSQALVDSGMNVHIDLPSVAGPEG